MPRLKVIGGIHTHLQVTHGINPVVVGRLKKERAEEVHYQIHRSGTTLTHQHGMSRDELAERARRAAQ